MSADTRSELEIRLFNPLRVGSVEGLVPRIADAWSLELPSLRALPQVHGPHRRLRFCIATEQVTGPVRNGGIGTTYAALSELIAELDYDITILYLRGREVETRDVEHWIRFYAEKGVTFVPVPNYAAVEDIRTNSDRWLRSSYNMMRYLQEHPMDVVHVSEWHGSGYLSLLAKRQGLDFDKTLFVVKTSSPWMWNRLYGSQTLERLDDLTKIHAERQSVELADIVIGGSLHLLRWMSSQGYRLPAGRTYVQPNVVSFDKLQSVMAKRSLERGTRIPIDEFVFFGRLEPRKGLFVFCQAIKRLIRMGVPLPKRITFMGKFGVRITARPNQTVQEYIESESAHWPTEVQVLNDFQQPEALAYLLDGPRLAVMPSVIENSSMAVYEAAICGIPCVASLAGGNSELVSKADWDRILCTPHPLPLADKLAEVLAHGGYVASPSFDNDANLETWRWFHRALSTGLQQRLLGATAPAASREPSRRSARSKKGSTGVCIYFTGREEALRATLNALRAQTTEAREVLIAVDGDENDAARKAAILAESVGVPCRIFETFDFDAGASFNHLAAQADSEFLLFLWEGATLVPHALTTLPKAAAATDADVLNYLYRVTGSDSAARDKGYLKVLVFGSISDSFFRNDNTGIPLYVRRKAFEGLGGFSTDYRVLCYDHELLAKAQLDGRRCETVLVELGSVLALDSQWLSNKCYDSSVSQFRAIRPQLAAAPLAFRDLLLASKGLQERSAGARRNQDNNNMARIMQSILLDAPKQPKPRAKPSKAPTD